MDNESMKSFGQLLNTHQSTIGPPPEHQSIDWEKVTVNDYCLSSVPLPKNGSVIDQRFVDTTTVLQHDLNRRLTTGPVVTKQQDAGVTHYVVVDKTGDKNTILPTFYKTVNEVREVCMKLARENIGNRYGYGSIIIYGNVAETKLTTSWS